MRRRQVSCSGPMELPRDSRLMSQLGSIVSCSHDPTIGRLRASYAAAVDRLSESRIAVNYSYNVRTR